MKKKDKLWAILHDGTFQGDSGFSCPGSCVEYKKGQTLKQLSQIYWDYLVKTDGYCEEDIKEDFPIKGAWILTNEHKNIVELVWECDPRGDSVVYQCNHTAKKMAANLAIKHLGKRAK